MNLYKEFVAERETTIPVRVSERELDVIDRYAAQKGLSRSAVLRLSILDCAKEAGITLRDEEKPKT